MGIVIFVIGMVVGCFIGVFLLAMVSTSPNSEETPDDTDQEG